MSMSISVPGSARLGRHVRHADRLLQERRLRAAGDHARPAAPVRHDRIAVAGDAAIDHLEADQLPRDAPCLLLAQPSRPMKSSLFQPTIQPRPASSTRGRFVDVVAVEAHRRLEPQRVAGAEAARNDVGGPSGLEQRLPDTRSAMFGGTKISKPSSPV